MKKLTKHQQEFWNLLSRPWKMNCINCLNNHDPLSRCYYSYICTAPHRRLNSLNTDNNPKYKNYFKWNGTYV